MNSMSLDKAAVLKTQLKEVWTYCELRGTYKTVWHVWKAKRWGIRVQGRINPGLLPSIEEEHSSLLSYELFVSVMPLSNSCEDLYIFSVPRRKHGEVHISLTGMSAIALSPNEVLFRLQFQGSTNAATCHSLDVSPDTGYNLLQLASS